jgi:hypothetical protein
MHSVTLRAGRMGRLMAFVVLGSAALGACSPDGQPLGARDQAAALPSTTLQELDCVGSVAGGITCTQARPRLGGASGAIYGGQNVFVRLTSSNASYDEGTETFSVNVTVQNLMNEAIGTPDGVTPDAAGIRVFVSQMPYSTGGPGDVTVLNADGTAWITAADQPYFRYDEVLETNEVSASKPWQFGMNAGVNTFSFKVLIQTEVQYKLVINEVMANAVGITSAEQPGEWFELYNAGSRPVDLQNLVIADSAASGRRPYHVINSSVVVPAGGYVVLGGSSNTTLNGGVPVDYSYGTALNQLANSLDAVKIARVVGNDTLTLDRTQYASAAISAQEGISRELKNPALDNSNMDGSNWGDASVTSVYGAGGRGTPKAQNSAYTP